MRRIRNPRYAPEFMERKLSPSAIVPASVAPVDYSTTTVVNDDVVNDTDSTPLTEPVGDDDLSGNVDVSSTPDSDPTSPYPTDPTPADPGTPDDGDGDPPTDPLPAPTPGPAAPAIYSY
jgi:hypothetical protein